jgi:hypothetical protein
MNFMRRGVCRHLAAAAKEMTRLDTAPAPSVSLTAMRCLLLFLFLMAPCLFAAEVPDPLYETRAEHDPNGIGKFFLGREIANVMGHQAAGWLERPEREEEERTDLLIDALKLKPGEVVADIGAGSGYFSWRMARLVGDAGKVYAVDIQEEMLDLLMKNMAKRRVGEIVEPILGTTTDPKLPPASCDTALMVDVYHEFDFPFEMIRNLITGLSRAAGSSSWSSVAKIQRCRSRPCIRSPKLSSRKRWPFIRSNGWRRSVSCRSSTS